jgi:hypothetical protein
VTAEGFNVMAKVLAFRSRRLAGKGKWITQQVRAGKVIEFPKTKSVNNSENVEIRKPTQAITPALFYGCF